jgi:glycosyltransferase involved in cell wall biosynthesis
MACGVPVVVADFRGQAELVRQTECGLVVPPDDPAALARAVAYLYERGEETREMGRRGRHAIETEHSWDHRAAATAAALRQLVGAGQQGG